MLGKVSRRTTARAVSMTRRLSYGDELLDLFRGSIQVRHWLLCYTAAACSSLRCARCVVAHLKPTLSGPYFVTLALYALSDVFRARVRVFCGAARRVSQQNVSLVVFAMKSLLSGTSVRSLAAVSLLHRVLCCAFQAFITVPSSSSHGKLVVSVRWRQNNPLLTVQFRG
jgi:hypothetical protein